MKIEGIYEYVTGAEKPWVCLECPEIITSAFATQDELLDHKLASIQYGKGHLKCHECTMQHHTSEGLHYHFQRTHPAEQHLKCPGCKQIFARVGGLMSHLERGDCRGIEQRQIFEQRIKKADFATKLQTIQDEHRQQIGAIGEDVLRGPAKSGSNFARYLGLSISDAAKPKAGSPEDAFSSGGASLDREADFPRAPLHDFRHGDSKQPDLLTADNLQALEQHLSNPWASAQKKDLFPKPAPVVRPSEMQLQEIRAKPKTKDEVMDPMDPDSPAFSASRFYNKLTEGFRCPHQRCGKTFPKSSALVTHLRSPAHSHRKFQCPSCLRFFNSAAALTSHAESQSNRCYIRNSDQYGAFIDQVTAGITDLDGRHRDETVRYKINDDASKPFMEGASRDRREMMKSNAQKAHDQAFQAALKEKSNYWDMHEPSWR